MRFVKVLWKECVGLIHDRRSSEVSSVLEYDQINPSWHKALRPENANRPLESEHISGMELYISTS